jgi:GNAT superfamily N-acetyltransferase
VALTVGPIGLEQTRALRHRVLRPHQRIDELVAHESPGAFAVGAFEGDDLVAVGFVTADGDRWRVRGMATEPEHRGRGAGARVLQALVAHAFAEGAAVVWANVRTPARSLYERAGFVVVSDEFVLDDIGPHVVMERSAEQD